MSGALVLFALGELGELSIRDAQAAPRGPREPGAPMRRTPDAPGDSGDPGDAAGRPAVGTRARGTVAQKKPKTPKKPRVHPGHGGARPGAMMAPPAAPATTANASANEAPSRPLMAFPMTVERATLDNGLRVVLASDRRSPTVAISLTYDLGSRLEERGHAGWVQLLSQVMLQGSANVAKGEHARLISARGGTFSTLVTSEVTTFSTVLPSRELPLALWLEVDRMKSLSLTTEGFEAERALAAESARRVITGQPFVAAKQRLRELVYQASWPYEHAPSGLVADIESAQLDNIKELYESACAPNNAVLTIAGDFDSDRAMQLVRRFFETARRKERGAVPAMPTLSEQTSQRSSVLEDSRAVAPAFFFGWAIPAARSEDRAALQVAAEILAGGPASRLGQHVIREKGMGSSVEASIDRTRSQDLLAIQVHMMDGQKRADVERVVDAELDALGKSGPTEAEMTRARNTLETSMLRSLESLDNRARELSWLELFHGDASLLKADVEQLGSVSREKVRAAVARYLTASRRTLVEVVPPPGAPPPLPAAKPPIAPVYQAPPGHTPQSPSTTTPQSMYVPPVSHPLHPTPAKPTQPTQSAQSTRPKPAKPKKK